LQIGVGRAHVVTTLVAVNNRCIHDDGGGSGGSDWLRRPRRRGRQRPITPHPSRSILTDDDFLVTLLRAHVSTAAKPADQAAAQQRRI